MERSERAAFAELLAMLGEAFNEPISDARSAAYWMALEDLPIEAVRCGVRATLQHSRFFPRPAEIRACAGEAPPDAGLVERMIYEHLAAPGGERRPVGDPFLRLIVERMGGLRSAGNMSSEDRLRLLDRLLPAVIQACAVRGIEMPSEASAALTAPRRLTLVHGAPLLETDEEG